MGGRGTGGDDSYKTKKCTSNYDGGRCRPTPDDCRGAPLLTFTHTTINKHTMEQVYIVKTRNTFIIKHTMEQVYIVKTRNTIIINVFF